MVTKDLILQGTYLIMYQGNSLSTNSLLSYLATYPPSTLTQAPVIQLASSLASTSAIFAISSGLPGPLNGYNSFISSIETILLSVVSLKMAVSTSMSRQPSVSSFVSCTMVEARKRTTGTDSIYMDIVSLIIKRRSACEIAHGSFRSTISRCIDS